MFSLAFGFFNWFSFQLVSLSLWTFFLRSSLYLGWACLMLIFKIDIFYGLTISLLQVLWFVFKCFSLLHLLCVLDDFGEWGFHIRALLHMVHEHWGASPFLFRALVCSNHKTLCFIWFVGSSRLLVSFWEMFRDISFICNLWSSI